MIDFDALATGPGMDAFGQPAIYTPAGGSASAITVVFDSAYRSTAFAGDGAPVTSVRPAVGVRLADPGFAGVCPKQGDRVSVAGVAYIVNDVQLDGMGSAFLPLNRAS